MVGSAPEVRSSELVEFIHQLREFLRQIEDGSMNLSKLKEINAGNVTYPNLAGDWLEPILAQNLRCLAEFGLDGLFDLSQPIFHSVLEKLGEQQIKAWRKMSLAPVYSPEILLDQNVGYRGFKVRPEAWYYEMAAAGRIYQIDEGGNAQINREPFRIKEGVYLIDTRCKPAYDGGRQMWDQDVRYLGWRLKKLREAGKIEPFAPPISRFRVSAQEAEHYVYPLLAGHADFKMAKEVRSESMIECSFFSQCFTYMPRVCDGETNTSVCFSDGFDGSGGRLDGGSSDDGGLAGVCHGRVGDHWASQSFRPVAVLY